MSCSATVVTSARPTIVSARVVAAGARTRRAWVPARGASPVGHAVRLASDERVAEPSRDARRNASSAPRRRERRAVGRRDLDGAGMPRRRHPPNPARTRPPGRAREQRAVMQPTRARPIRDASVRRDPHSARDDCGRCRAEGSPCAGLGSRPRPARARGALLRHRRPSPRRRRRGRIRVGHALLGDPPVDVRRDVHVAEGE